MTATFLTILWRMFMDRPSEYTEFEQLINPTDTIITLIYRRELKYRLLEFFTKYESTSLTNPNALKELEALIKEFVSRTLQLLSGEYLKKLHLVFNDDGIIYYIYSHFYSLTIAELEEKTESLPK